MVANARSAFLGSVGVPTCFYCHLKGLQEDLSRRPPAAVADRPEDRDRTVRAALAAFEQALRESDAVTAEWEAIALAGYQTRARRATDKQVILVAGELREILPPGTSDAEISRLRESEEAG